MTFRRLTHRAQACLLGAVSFCLSTGASAQGVVPERHSILSLVPEQSTHSLLETDPAARSFAHPRANFHAFASARAGETGPTEKLTFRFSAASTVTRIESTKDVVIEQGGSCVEGRSFAKDETCALLVRFTPQGPGNRLGKITMSHTASPQPEAFGIGGYGYAPIASFTPSQITTVPATVASGIGLLNSAHNVFVDGNDTLYIADTGNNRVGFIDSSGIFTALVSGNFAPWGVAVDSMGQTYFSTPAEATNKIFEIYDYGPAVTLSGSTAGSCPASSPCDLGEHQVNYPGVMSMDRYNNMFWTDDFSGAAFSTVQPSPANLIYLYDPFPFQTDPTGSLVVDNNDNIYSLWSNGGTCSIMQQTLSSAENSENDFTKIAGGHTCGFSGDGGPAGNAEIGNTSGQMVIDTAGNLYFSDTANQRVRRIDYVTGTITTIAGNGTAGYSGDGGAATGATLSSPTGVGVDSQGQVYIMSNAPSSAATQVIRKVGTVGYLNMGAITLGASSAAQTVQLANTGNASLTFTNEAFSSGNSGDFTVDPVTTTCNFTAALPGGSSCRIGFFFKPTAGGARSTVYTITDSTVAGLNTIQLVGTGVTTATLTPAAMAFASTAVGSTSAAQTATLTNTGSAVLTISSIALGGAQAGSFVKSTTCGASLAAGANCTINVAFAPGATGALAATLTVADNTAASSQSVSLTGTGAAGTAKAAALTSPTPGSTLAGATVTFSWSAATGATTYALNLGSTGANSSNLYNSGHITATSATATSLPTNGETFYAELWAYVNNAWVTTNYTYQAAASPTPALTSPARGSVLPGATATFTWTPVAGATVYALNLGSTGVDSANLYNSGHITSTSVTVKNLPTNGETIYARLWAFVKNAWVTTDYTYTAAH
jgi:hypothetical protein